MKRIAFVTALTLAVLSLNGCGRKGDPRPAASTFLIRVLTP